MAAILFELDPIGINFECNTDEYEPEVGTILPRLCSCNSKAEVRQMVHDEFERWFAPMTVGPESSYDLAAELIWAAWNEHIGREPEHQGR